MSHRSKPGGHAPDQRSGCVALVIARRQIRQINHIHRKALRLDADDPIVIFRRHRNHIEVDARRQNTPVLMIRVIPAHLGASRRAEQADLTARAEQCFKLQRRIFIARALLLRFFAVKIAKRLIKCAAVNPCHRLDRIHLLTSHLLDASAGCHVQNFLFPIA